MKSDRWDQNLLVIVFRVFHDENARPSSSLGARGFVSTWSETTVSFIVLSLVADKAVLYAELMKHGGVHLP